MVFYVGGTLSGYLFPLDVLSIAKLFKELNDVLVIFNLLAGPGRNLS